MNYHKKIVLFGAGKIGRSFIGQLFSRSGYSVVFVEVLKPLVDALNERQRYNVVIKDKTDQIIEINNVRAVLATETDKVIDEIASASICAVSIGQQGLPSVFPVLAKGLLKRQNSNCTLLDIIKFINQPENFSWFIYFDDKIKK